MYIGRDFSPMEQDEVIGKGLDFVDDIIQGETLQSAQWFMTVVDGIDADPSSHLVGPPSLATPDGSIYQTATVQAIGGILPGVTYKVRALVTTSLGNSVSLWTHIRGVDTL